MARTIDEIQTEIINAVQADPVLSGLTSPSAVAIWRLWTRVLAGGLETEEQLNDVFRAELEQIAREAVPGTSDWLQKRVLEFQYDPANPQVVQVIDGKATYSTIDESLRIVTRVAVKSQPNGRVLVKVAKDDGGGGLIPLDANEVNGLVSYLSRIGFVGIPIDVSSQQADRVRLDGYVVYYRGSFDPSALLASIVEAVDNYLASVSVEQFDGVVVRTAITDAIQSVDGVVVVSDSAGGPFIRDFGTLAPGGVEILTQRETLAGYAISEDAPGYTLADTLTLLPESNIPNT